jgi:hypothetical protein
MADSRSGDDMLLTLVLLILPMQEPVNPATTTNAAGALAAFKVAVERGDVAALAAVTAGDTGVALRKIAPRHAKAREASDRLDRLVAERAELSFKNPFTAGLQPLADLQCDILELSESGAATSGAKPALARLRFGPRGKAQEEAIFVRNEQGTWRIELPGMLAKQLQPLTGSERLDRQLKGLEKLAELLEALTKEVQAGTLKTKEAVTLRLVGLVNEYGLTELLK